MLHVIRPQLGQFYSRQLSCPAVFASQEANAEPAAEFTAPQGELALALGPNLRPQPASELNALHLLNASQRAKACPHRL